MRYITILLATTFSLPFVSFVLVIILSPAPIKAEYWVGEMIVIKRNIAKQYTGQKKLIIASGSNTLFGIGTTQLGTALGIPVINFGLHAGLALETILEEAGNAAERGDVIILPLEPSYYCINEPTPWQVKNSIAWERNKWKSWSLLQKAKAISLIYPSIITEVAKAKLQEKFWPETIKDRLITLDDQETLHEFALASSLRVDNKFYYSAYNLDPMGNMKNTERDIYLGYPRRADSKIEICPASWQLLNGFKQRMDLSGVEIYFANSPFVDLADLDYEKIEATSKQFAAELSKLAPVLDTKSEMVFNRKLFYDTDLHLNAEGRMIRTQLLANSIHNNAHLIAHIQTK